MKRDQTSHLPPPRALDADGEPSPPRMSPARAAVISNAANANLAPIAASAVRPAAAIAPRAHADHAGPSATKKRRTGSSPPVPRIHPAAVMTPTIASVRPDAQAAPPAVLERGTGSGSFHLAASAKSART